MAENTATKTLSEGSITATKTKPGHHYEISGLMQLSPFWFSGWLMLESMRQFKAGIFQALSHPTRVAIVEQLRGGDELTVNQLCEKVGIEQSNASQHLAVLRNRYVVESRKAGNQIFYRLRNPLLGDVLDIMRAYFQAHMTEAVRILQDESEGEHPLPVPETAE